MQSIIQNNKGFSLIELLVGFALLTIGMMAIGTMVNHASQTSRFSSEISSAESLAQEIIENIKSEAGTMKSTDLLSHIKMIKLERLKPDSTTQYIIKDSDTLNYSSSAPKYYERFGEGQGFKYRWRLEEVTETSFPSNQLKLEVLLGWKYCPDQEPLNCRYKSRVSSFVLFK